MREKITQSIIMVSLMLGLASVPSAALAVYFDDRISACQPFKKIAIPKADLPTEADRKRLKSPGSACFELTEDSVTERLCAYLDREGDDPDDNDLFSGSGMLLMIYANGRGVQRNISLAKRFACEIRGMDEHVIEARFSHLDEIAQDPSRSPVFEACDGIVRSDMDGLCAAYSTDDVRIKRDQQLNTLISRWSGSAQEKFKAVQNAKYEYIDAHVYQETDQSGSGKNGYNTYERECLENDFMQSLLDFESEKWPAALIDGLQNAIVVEKAAYIDATAAAAFAIDEPNGVQPDGIREAEEKWQTFLDSWSAFAAEKYPSVNASSWQTYFLHKREKILKSGCVDYG